MTAPILSETRRLVGRGYYGSRRIDRNVVRASRNLAPTDFGAGSAVQRCAQAAAARGCFLGGPAATFHALGAHQFVTLLEQGLEPQSRVLDVGCGCLRAGYWLIAFLNRGCYFGIEPNRGMLAMGLSEILPPTVAEAKQPRFDHNDSFDFGVFGERFDFVLARSVWSHAAPHQIDHMLDQFAHTATFAACFSRPTTAPDCSSGSTRVPRGLAAVTNPKLAALFATTSHGFASAAPCTSSRFAN